VADFTPENAIEVMTQRIEANGYQPKTATAVQKALDAYLVTVTFEGSKEERQGVVTRQQVDQLEA
jgi:hypothetical protein